MVQVVEMRGLATRDEAERRAEDFRIDDVPVEIVANDDGTFTVRATYPDDVHLPDAMLSSLAPSQSVPGPPPAPPPATAGAKTLSPKGAALIKAFESCMEAVPGGFRAYLDPVNVLTIGWGHTNHNAPTFAAGDVWTQTQCDQAFLGDMAVFEAAVNRDVTVPLNQDQFDALVSFTFNLGEGNLKSSTLLRKLNAGDYAGAAQEFKRWNKAGGKVLPGLTRRRACEALLFQSIPDANYDGVPD